ncbi:MAG: hypothetical protein ACK4PR_08955, partial [Gammaproteobacteria bacterium]
MGVQTKEQLQTLLKKSEKELTIKEWFWLGFCYDEGRDVLANADKAQSCYAKALGRDGLDMLKKMARDSDSDAQFIVGLVAENGLGGKSADLESAVKCYQEAVKPKKKDKGSAEAQYRLGCFHEMGYPVALDMQEAMRLFKLAADQGHSLAKKKIQQNQSNNNSISAKAAVKATPVAASSKKPAIQKATVAKSQSSQVKVAKVDASVANANNVQAKLAKTIVPTLISTNKQVPNIDDEEIVYKKLTEFVASQCENDLPEEKRASSKVLNEVLESLWQAKASFYLTPQKAQALYKESKIDTNPLTLYVTFVKGKLLHCIFADKLTELENALTLITAMENDESNYEIDKEVQELCFSPWIVAFRLGLSLNKNDACALLLRYTPNATDKSIQRELKLLATAYPKVAYEALLRDAANAKSAAEDRIQFEKNLQKSEIVKIREEAALAANKLELLANTRVKEAYACLMDTFPEIKVHKANVTVEHMLEKLSFVQLLLLQDTNEDLMLEEDDTSVPLALLKATKNLKTSATIMLQTYEILYSRPDFMPILDIAYLATKQLHRLGSPFNIFVDEKSSNLSSIKVHDSRVDCSSVVGLSKPGPRNSKYTIFLSIGQERKDIDIIKGTAIHELTHFVTEDCYDNKRKPYEKDDEATELRFNKILDRLRSNYDNLPPLFKKMFDKYSEADLHKELIAYTAQFLSGFPDETEA